MAPNDRRMPLGQHLEELRACLIKSFVVLVALFAAGVAFKDTLIRVMLIPWDTARESILESGARDPGLLVNIAPAEPLIFALKVAFAAAILAGAPVYLWQVWKFISVGLVDQERAAITRSFPVSVLMFAAGLAFGFFVLLPLGLRFLLTYISELIVPTVTAANYFSLVTALTLLMGFVFQLPLIMWLVVRVGIVELSTLSSSRRVAILVILVFASIMTPPDVITQVLVALPMVALYEIGLLLGRRAEAARLRSER